MRRTATYLSAAITCISGMVAFAGDMAPMAHAPQGRAVSAHSDELMQSGTPAAVAVVRRQMWMEVTAYCPCTKCCGPHANGVTASGLPVTYNLGRFAAADSAVLPIGSSISVPGYHDGLPVPVIDRGGAIKGDKLDVFFPTHERALQWGRRWALVTIDTTVPTPASPA